MVGGFTMMNALQFYNEELNKVLDPKAPADVVAVQRGLLLYRQEMVDRLIREGETIEATVKDVIPCTVKLDLTFPVMSSCTCKQPHPCRHQLAVFFKAYASHASISDWIHAWKNGASKAPAANIQLQKAKELLNEKPLANTYESWKAYTEKTFQTNIAYFLNQPTYTLTVKWDTYLQRLKARTPMQNEWKMLYSFVTKYLTFFLCLKSLKAEETGNSARYFLNKEAEALADELITMLVPLTRISRPFAFDGFFNGIREDTGNLLDYDSLPGHRIDLYRELWNQLLKEKAWRIDELSRLEKIDNSSQSFVIAAIHLSLLTEQNDRIGELLEQLEPEHYPAIKYWLYKADGSQAEPFVLFLLGHIREYLACKHNYYMKKEFIQFVSRYVQQYCLKSDRPELFDQFCETCLPYSFTVYSNHLIETGRHRKWVELYLYNGIDPEYISSDEISLINKEDPSLLLPLYTRLVTDKIGSKNRQGYRAAVRYLKKIRTIYKKTKNIEQWNLYIDKIQNANKRLRAFQEELKRGKLIDAD